MAFNVLCSGGGECNRVLVRYSLLHYFYVFVFYIFISCPALPCPTQTSPAQPSHALSCSVLFCSVLFCPALPRPVPTTDLAPARWTRISLITGRCSRCCEYQCRRRCYWRGRLGQEQLGVSPRTTDSDTDTVFQAPTAGNISRLPFSWKCQFKIHDFETSQNVFDEKSFSRVIVPLPLKVPIRP